MKQIQLTQGQFTIIDNKNYEWLNQWKWSAQWNKNTQSFYAMRSSKRKNGKQRRISMARKILGLNFGDKREADHINHETLDNRESNIRIVTRNQNQWNQKNPKGYWYNPKRHRYMVGLRLNGKRIYVGSFQSTEEAHNSYLKAKRKYHKLI